MKVKKNGVTFSVTVDDASIAARFLRSCGFTIVSEPHDPQRSPTLREADVAKRAEKSEDDIWNDEWHDLYDEINEARRNGEIER